MARTVHPLILIVSPRTKLSRLWPARAAGKPISIESYAHASNAAARAGNALHIHQAAWAQMLAAGMAPDNLPDDVLLI